jgi:hypothetical protein
MIIDAVHENGALNMSGNYPISEGIERSLGRCYLCEEGVRQVIKMPLDLPTSG